MSTGGGVGQDEPVGQAGFQPRLDLPGDGILLLLGLLTRLDQLADLARVLPVEGLAQGVGERGVLGEADRHADPRHRLQQRPMATDHRDQQESQERLKESGAHD